MIFLIFFVGEGSGRGCGLDCFNLERQEVCLFFFFLWRIRFVVFVPSIYFNMVLQCHRLVVPFFSRKAESPVAFCQDLSALQHGDS